jgi:hypothetical protein
MLEFKTTGPYKDGWLILYVARQVIDTEMNACMDIVINERDEWMCELEQPSKWSRKKVTLAQVSRMVAHIHRMA